MNQISPTERDEWITKKQAQGAAEAIAKAAEEVGFMKAVEMLRSLSASGNASALADWLVKQRGKGK